MTESGRLSSEMQCMVTEELIRNLHELLLAVKELKALSLEIARVFRDIDERLKLANGTADLSNSESGFIFPGRFSPN